MAAPMHIVRENSNSQKRSFNDKSIEKVPSKKPKVKALDHIEFKSYLKDPKSANLGFEKFLQAAADHTDGVGEDIVFKYCHSSPECSEIFQVLEIQQNKSQEVQLVFKCLEVILLRIADDLGQFYKSGQNIVTKLLAGHSFSILKTLNVKSRSNQIKTSLKLLISMVMIGGPSTKLVLNNVDLAHKFMLPLLQRRDVKDEEDVRTCFIHLIVACLLAGDNDAVKKLVQMKGLLENVFHGVEFDRVNTLQLLLSTLLEKVILNPAISKTTKVHMFSEQGLKELGRLYNWQGLAKWKQTLKQKGKQPDTPYMETDDSREDKLLVEQLVHKFLTEVCTSYKHGIIFHDKTYGLSARNQNHLMTKFVGNLSGYLANDLVKKLVIDILTACPDQLQYYLPNITDSLVPRMTKKWIDSMDFLMKIYSSVRGHIPVLHMREKKNVGSMVQILMVYTMPTSQVLKTILPGAKDKGLVINSVTLRLVKQMTDTAGHVLKLIQNLPGYTSNENMAINNMYKAFVLKNLPDVMDILNCLDRVLQKTVQEDIEKLQEFCGVGLCEVMIQLEQIICLYQDLQPTLLTEHPSILGKLIEGIMEKEWTSVSSNSYHLMKVYLLKLMAGTESRQLPWAKKNTSGQTLMYQLLAMLTELSADKELADTTLQLVCKLLESTNQFENHHADLQIWLNALLYSQTNILDYVTKVMITYIHNPYPYMDRLCDIQLHSDLNLASPSNERQKFDIDAVDVMDLEEDISEPLSKGVQRFPFCPLVIVGLDTLEKMETVPKEIQEYITRVILGTFHQQSCPVALCNLMVKYNDSLFLPGMLDYILTWLKPDDETADCLLSKTMYKNFLTKNPDFVTGDSSLFTIQQDLLNLTYVIKHSKKMDVKRYMKEIKSLKKSLIRNVQQLCGEMDVEESKGEDVNDVIVNEIVDKSNTSLPGEAVRTVLQSSVCKQYFLSEEMKSQSTKIVNIMTDIVKDVVQLSNDNGKRLEDCIYFYHDTLLSVLRTSTRNNSRDLLVLQVLPVFVPTFEAEQCKEILELSLNCEVDNKDGEATDMLMPVLEKILPILYSQSHIKCVKLTENGVDSLVNCFVNGEKSSELLLKFFQTFPMLSAQCSVNIVEKLFEMTEHAGLVVYLLENNARLKMKVGEIIQSSDYDWTQADNMKVLMKYIQLESGKSGKRTKKTTEKAVKMLWPKLMSICGGTSVDNFDDLKQMAELLISNNINGEKFAASMKKELVMTVEQNVENIRQDHIDLLHMLYRPRDVHDLLCICIRSLVVIYEREGIHVDIQDGLVNILAGCTMENLEALGQQSELKEYWPKLVENIIKCSYNRANTLKFVASLVQLVNKQEDVEVTVAGIAAMVTSHPLFQPVMFGEHGQDSKDMLVNLLLVMVELCPACCHGDHIGVFLGAYRASLSITDQKILKLMQLYEKQGITSDSKSLMWGEKAVEQHMLRESLGPSLKQTTATELMSNIDIDMMSNSILLFPLRRKLQDLEPRVAEEYKSDSKCYDPSFILPLLGHLVQPESVIDCRRFIHTGCLSYTVAALSSHEENIRTLAQLILEKYRGHLEGARVPEKEQLTYMLQVIQNSLPKTKNKLSCIISQFLARSVKLMLKPDDHMYTIINQFLLLKPNLDIGNIPEFFKLFNSSAMQYQVERSWMLSLMKDGLRESADYWIFEKRFTFKLLQSFYDSKMADSHSKVLNIVMSACKERRLALDLCQNHGLLTWISAAAYKLSSDRVDLCTSVCNLLHQIWRTVMEESRDSVQSIQLSFSTQILVCLKTLLPHIGYVEGKVKLQFGRNLSSVLIYLTSIEKNIRGQVSQMLTQTELLTFILHCQKLFTVSKNLTHLIKNFVSGSVTDLAKDENIKTLSSHHVHIANVGNLSQSVVVEEAVVNAELGECMIEEIVKIMEQLKRNTDREVECCAGDVLIVRWLIDQIGGVRNISITYRMVQQLHSILKDGKENSITLVLHYISCTNSNTTSELVVDIVNLYSRICDLHWSATVKDIQSCQGDFLNTTALLNDIMAGVYRHKFCMSQNKMEKALDKQVKKLEVSGDDNEEQLLKCVALRRMFVEKL